MKKTLKTTDDLRMASVKNTPQAIGTPSFWGDFWLCEEHSQFVTKPLGDELRHEPPEQILYKIYHYEKGVRYPLQALQRLFMNSSIFEKASAHQREEPLFLLNWADRKFWWYRDQFWESTVYSDEEVKLLLWEKGRREQRKFKRLAKAKAAAKEALEEAGRERIPEEVRLLVWERDGGRCVKCGSTEDLEFDHIIPVSKGGSNTEKNVQLLCVKCNREKGDRMA